MSSLENFKTEPLAPIAVSSVFCIRDWKTRFTHAALAIQRGQGEPRLTPEGRWHIVLRKDMKFNPRDV
jgi:hypothetical protein